MTDFHVSEIRFAPATATERTVGLLGFVAVTVGDTWRIDGIAVRRTASGAVVLSFPERRDARGRRHPIVRPANRAARAAITQTVLDALLADFAAAIAAMVPRGPQADCAR